MAKAKKKPPAKKSAPAKAKATAKVTPKNKVATKAAKKPPAKKPPAAKVAKKPLAQKAPAKTPPPIARSKKPPYPTQPTTAPLQVDPPPVAELARMAIEGDVDGLFRLMDADASSSRDTTAYKWLAVAADFGHEGAEDAMDDLLEASSLRYDDDQFETGNAHWELGLAYLAGTDGLPRDLDRARSQLTAAKERGWPLSVQQGTEMLAAARAGLADDALAVFDAVAAATVTATGDDDDDDDE